MHLLFALYKEVVLLQGFSPNRPLGRFGLEVAKSVPDFVHLSSCPLLMRFLRPRTGACVPRPWTGACVRRPRVEP